MRIKLNNVKFLVIGILIGMSGLAQSDSYEPSHSCSKPYKPYQFNHQYEVDNFNNEVDTYKTCINNFVSEQNNAIENHKSAAESAISEWNSFVNYEL